MILYISNSIQCIVWKVKSKVPKSPNLTADLSDIHKQSHDYWGPIVYTKRIILKLIKILTTKVKTNKNLKLRIYL